MAARKYWACRKCAARWPRTIQKCRTELCDGRRPAPRAPRHARTLQTDSYQRYNDLNRQIHGVADESCGACKKPRSQERKHDRDHDHRSGNPRGLLCGGNQGCNILLLPWVTAATAKGIAQAKEVAGEKDSERWWLLHAYLARVEDFYDREAAA